MASVGKRKAERRGCQVKAQILSSGGAEPIDCIILDFSATGARVKLNAPRELPARFKLYIPSRPETKNVLLRWTKGLEFGCEYSTGLADENTFFELIDRVAKLESAAPAASGGAPAALDEITARIEALEARLGQSGSASPAEPALDVEAAEAIRLRIDQVAQASETQVRRSESVLVARMDELEQRLRATLAPDAAQRLARLEAAVEAGAFEQPATAMAPTDSGPDARIVARLADIEARLMAAPRAPQPAFDPSMLEAKIEQSVRRVEERAERIERFLMTRIDNIETQMISAPDAPAPLRSSEIADLDLRLHQLAARFEESAARASNAPRGDAAAMSEDFARLAERVSDLEMSVMELRLGDAPAKPQDDEDLPRRIVEIEGRHAEIIATLRNLLALLSATEGRRHAG